MNTSTDRIERKIVLKAPLSRVWRAVSNAEEFGGWFGVDFKGQTFIAGKPAASTRFRRSGVRRCSGSTHPDGISR